MKRFSIPICQGFSSGLLPKTNSISTIVHSGESYENAPLLRWFTRYYYSKVRRKLVDFASKNYISSTLKMEPETWFLVQVSHVTCYLTINFPMNFQHLHFLICKSKRIFTIFLPTHYEAKEILHAESLKCEGIEPISNTIIPI